MITRKYITFIIVLGSVVLFGLLAIQFYWIQNTYHMKEAQLEHSVVKSMYGIRRAVAKNEAIKRMSGSKWLKHLNGKVGQNKQLSIDTIVTKNGQQTEIRIRERDSSTGSYSEQYFSVSDDSWAAEMMQEMFAFSPFTSLEDRMSFAELDSIVTDVLHENGIKSKVDFAVFNQFNQPVIYSKEKKIEQLSQLLNSRYKIGLLKNDFIGPEYYLAVNISNKKGAVLHSMIGVLLLSFFLMLSIIALFYFAISTILKQKKLSIIKNDFINNMTHELKTPISTISLACEMLSDSSLKQSDEQKKNFIGMIRDENKRLGNLVESVLQTAIIDKGELKFKPEKLSVHQIIANAVKNIQIQVEQKSGKIEQQLDAKTDEVEGDKTHLTNVVYNLLDNANKYSHDIPEISISTENVVNGIVIKVKDNGIGISKENQQKIFDRLFRVPTGDVHNVKGFGLGLSYVKAIVDKHGGNISVESELGKGSTFSVFLPKTIQNGNN